MLFEQINSFFPSFFLCSMFGKVKVELEHQNNMAYPQLVSSPTESSIYGQR